MDNNNQLTPKAYSSITSKITNDQDITFAELYNNIITGKVSLNSRESSNNIYIAEILVAQFELKKLIRLVTLTDKLYSRFEEQVYENLDEYTTGVLASIIETLNNLADRSLSIMQSVSSNPNLSMLVDISSEYQSKSKNEALQSLQDPVARENLRCLASELIDSLNSTITNNTVEGEVSDE